MFFDWQMLQPDFPPLDGGGIKVYGLICFICPSVFVGSLDGHLLDCTHIKPLKW